MSVDEGLVTLPPGIYDNIPAVLYHADKLCPEPSLSSSIAKLLCLSSPMHARMAHPRLNPQAVEKEDERFDIGTAAHAVLLEGTAAVQIIDAKDWRTNVAKDARDKARAEGKIPLLPHIWKDVEAMVVSARRQLLEHTDGGQDMFRGGKPEQTLVWQEDDGTWCRSRTDWLRPGAVDDFKTCPNANPEVCSRTLFANGYDIQAAFYLRGVKRLTGEDAVFRFAFIEKESPYALSVVGLGPDAMMLAEKKVLYALEQWRECLDAKYWPGYPRQTCWASLPSWEENRWLVKETEGKVFE
jgi:hypothetical protein